jgi:hypothetical protein
LGLAFH